MCQGASVSMLTLKHLLQTRSLFVPALKMGSLPQPKSNSDFKNLSILLTEAFAQ